MSMMRYRVRVFLKEGISDPQGLQIQQVLNKNDFDVQCVRAGKVIEFDSMMPVPAVEKMCEEYLANPVMEDYEIFFAEPVEEL